ncbi:MAG: hypothetical protein ACI4B3_05135 [Prevotella sp.]
MKLLNGFYTIIKDAPSSSPKGESHVGASTVRSHHSPLGETEGASGTSGASPSTFKIRFCPEHAIFKAHFPGLPIVPGVCTIQIVTELAELCLNRSLRLCKAKNVKFLSLLTPVQTPEVEVCITIDGYHVKAVVTHGDVCFAKLSLCYE